MDTIGVQELADRGDVPLVDVREPDEYAGGHAPGARLIPLGEVEDRIGEVPAGERVYVICASGMRSARAAEAMQAHGIDAVSVEGGTKAWIAAGLPVERGA